MSEYIVCPYCHNPLSQSEYVKVVRCRDCEYQNEPWNCAAPYSKEPNGFCFWAARKVGS